MPSLCRPWVIMLHPKLIDPTSTGMTTSVSKARAKGISLWVFFWWFGSTKGLPIRTPLVLSFCPPTSFSMSSSEFYLLLLPTHLLEGALVRRNSFRCAAPCTTLRRLIVELFSICPLRKHKGFCNDKLLTSRGNF
jgi:hypothetical protein